MLQENEIRSFSVAIRFADGLTKIHTKRIESDQHSAYKRIKINCSNAIFRLFLYRAYVLRLYDRPK